MGLEERDNPPGCRQEGFGLGCAGPWPGTCRLLPALEAQHRAMKVVGMRCSPWPLPVGSGQRGRSRKDPFGRGRAPATRNRAEGLGLDPTPQESTCPNLSSPWDAVLAPRAGQCVLREGDRLVWRTGPNSEWLQEAQQDWDCKAANSCRVLLAGSARSLVPCSELIIR